MPSDRRKRWWLSGHVIDHIVLLAGGAGRFGEHAVADGGGREGKR